MHRLMDWLSQRRFQVLLTTLGMLLIAYPILQNFVEGRLFFNILIGIVFLASLMVLLAGSNT